MPARKGSAGAVLLLIAFAAFCGAFGPSFLSTQPSGAASSLRSADAKVAAISHDRTPAAYAVFLASAPAPAHAGGMFDFGLTLPFVAITFLLMMVTLNALWYGPVLSEQDDRNAKLLQTLSEATDNLAQADKIQTDYTAKIREAREKASLVVAKYRELTEKDVSTQMAAAKSNRDQRVAEVKATLDEEMQKKIASAEAEIVKRKQAFVKKTLTSIGA
eukprot:TRINITY_DN1766_c0_g1_i8.p2 TRINITY_DN1766_c0_g1~~TRINITY_DN1766_c0_g1_i8.p2  ORF type:complete len:217 (-),score=75.13 TRINITY_DN1766_c0_g1_i8:121-771(-)